MGSNNIQDTNNTNHYESSMNYVSAQSVTTNTTTTTSNNNNNILDERMIVNGKTTQKYNENKRLVESWKEELYMMNVKNSILLDDLVKLGADV